MSPSAAIESVPHARAPHGALRQQVLELAWARESCTVREIHDASGRRVAYTTVQTVMARLAARGLLTRAMDGHVWRYRRATSVDASAAEQLVDQLLGRFGELAVAQFVTRTRMDPERFEQLRELVDAPLVHS